MHVAAAKGSIEAIRILLKGFVSLLWGLWSLGRCIQRCLLLDWIA